MEATELTVRPPLMIHANGAEGAISTRPGALIYLKAGTREFPQPLNHGARPDFAAAEIERRAKAIEKAFHTDRLRLPEQDRMTATEIIARQRQGLIVTSPILGRLYSELLNPIIQLTFRAMSEAKLFPATPRALANQPLGVAYLSPLAGSRGGAQLDAVQTTIAALLPLGQINPTVFDRLDLDRIVSLVASAATLDPTAMRSLREMKAMRDAQSKAMQQQQMAQTASLGAKALRDASAAGAAQGAAA